jgi:hypothetical protein
MRLIFFWILICFSAITAFAQQPSRQEMQEQLAQAKKEAMEQVAELEKQIAEAKANKEDPGSIKEMEKQLATLKQIFGVLNQDLSKFGRPEKIPEIKYNVPKFVSPIIPILLKQPVTAPGNGQAKDSLLWYTGKRLNDSMLVTTQSTVVLYSKKRNMLIVQPEKNKDSVFLNLAANLGKCRQWTTQYIDKLASEKNSFFFYPQIVSNVDKFKSIEDRYYEMARNTIDLSTPQNLNSSVANDYSPVARGPFSILFPDNISPDDALTVLHRDMVNYMNSPPPAGMGSNSPPMEFFDDYCNYSNCVNDRDKIIRDWQAQFLQYEQVLLAKMAAVKLVMADRNISSAASGIPTLNQDIQRAIDIAFQRWDQKVNKLETFPVRFMGIVIENLLFLQSQKKRYLGIVDNSYTNRIRNKLTEYKNEITLYYEKCMNDKDYDWALNDELITAYNRHYKLSYGGNADPLAGLVSRIKAFNRFSLTIDLDFDVELKTGDDQLIEANGKLTNKNKIYVSLGRAGNCTWQLFLTNTDYNKADETSFRLPLIVRNGIKSTYFKNPLRVVKASYSGPQDVLMVFPYSKMNFCNMQQGVSDTIVVDLLRYKTENVSMYRPRAEEYSVDLMIFVNKLFMSYEMAYYNSQEMVMNANERMNAVILNRKVDYPTGYPSLDIMQVDFKLINLQQRHQQMLANITHFPNTLFRPRAVRGNPKMMYVNEPLRNTESLGTYNLKDGHVNLIITHDPQ